MASDGKSPKVALMEEILLQGQLAFDPQRPTELAGPEIARFNQLLARTKTFTLIPVLTTLMQPGRSEEWLRPHVTRALALLPLRPHGVRNTIEFILSVHPTTKQPDTKAESRGPSISLEALKSASKLISSPPSGMSTEEWYSGIAAQLMGLLDGQGGLEMVKASSYIIGYGILGRREYGAPGTAGWKYFAESMLRDIDPTLGSKGNSEILDARNVLVSSTQLSDALRRLASLLSSHPNPGLSKRVLSKLLLPLWSLSSWSEKDGLNEESRAPAGYLLQILLQLSDDSVLTTICRNMMYRGLKGRVSWTYAVGDGGIQIERWNGVEEDVLGGAADEKIKYFVDLLKPSKDSDAVPTLFLFLIRNWLTKSSLEDDETKLIEAKVMQRMMDEIPERLVGDSTQVLELVGGVLEKTEEGDELDVSLSLLNMVFTSANFDKTKNREVLASVKRSLGRLSKTSVTAQNLLFLLEFAGEEEVPVDRNSEDRRTYKLAMSYLTGVDSPPPVRAQGLDLLSGLIASGSPILDIPATMVLLSSLLQDEEEYIYLRCIKSFTSLSIRHPKAVIEGLLERYVDVDEELGLDARLRIGEGLLQVMEKAGETFTGDIKRVVGEGLLGVAGRRGYRPKQEEKQKQAAKTAGIRRKEAEEAWDGPVPQMEEPENEILTQIVEGWEGKRGEEDVRIRASALSLLGSVRMNEAVDMAVNIMAMEPEYEKAILRRAAILLVMDVVRDGDLGLQGVEDVLRVLRYIEGTDNDQLVRDNAAQVVGMLERWRVETGVKGLSVRRAKIEEIE